MTKHQLFKRIALALLLGAASFPPAAQAQQVYAPTWASLDTRPTPPWFEEAKFGIFIHWGVFSVPAYSPTARDGVGVYERYAEWYWKRLVEPGKNQAYFTKFNERVYGPNAKYQDFAASFKAELFQPTEWAAMLKQSGAKYVVLTTKHHEGFTLWPSAQSWNWNAVDVGPHRDLVGDLTEAVRAQGVRMGFYYSLYEWFNPQYKADVKGYVDQHMLPQLKDLVTRYQPDVLWADGEWEQTSDTWRSPEFLAWLYNNPTVKDKIVVNDRWGKDAKTKHGDFYTTEYDLIDHESAAGKRITHPWEECRGMAGSFGYNRDENLGDYSTSADLVRTLLDKVARGGNLLLNIGPTADGRIPVIMQQRLKDMGDWLAVNGEAIYGTRAWAAAPAATKDQTIFYTQKGADLYVIVTKWPEKPFVVKGLKSPTGVRLVGSKVDVKTAFTGEAITITPPLITPATTPCQHAWAFRLVGAVQAR